MVSVALCRGSGRTPRRESEKPETETGVRIGRVIDPWLFSVNIRLWNKEHKHQKEEWWKRKGHGRWWVVRTEIIYWWLHNWPEITKNVQYITAESSKWTLAKRNKDSERNDPDVTNCKQINLTSWTDLEIKGNERIKGHEIPENSSNYVRTYGWWN